MPRLQRALIAVGVMVTIVGCANPGVVPSASPSPAGQPASVQGTATTAGTTVSPTQVTPSRNVPAPEIKPGTTGKMEVRDRPLTVVVPKDYSRGKPTGLLVVLHGYGDRAESAFRMLNLADAAADAGMLVALPEGTEDPDRKHFWNASRACCNFFGSEVDDTAFLTEAIARVEDAYAVDSRRVYLVGHSNGGFMAYRMACQRADQITAVVSLAGAMDAGGECRPSRSVSVLEIHGDADTSVRYNGGDVQGKEYTSAYQTVETWQALSGCVREEVEIEADMDLVDDVSGDETSPLLWTGCQSGAEVGLWTIKDGGHNPELNSEFGDAVVAWLERQATR